MQGRSHRSQLSSVPACQRIVKRAIVKRLQEAHRAEHLPETGPRCSIEISLRDDVAMLTLDTTGAGLHKRGYRRLVGEAQLRETLAAALVQLSFWRPGRVLADPFCGTGTIPIEAALIGRNIAPGLNREFVAETWPTLDARNWQIAREEARDLVRTAAERTAFGLRHRPGSAGPGPLSRGAGRRGRRHPLARTAVHRAAGKSRIWLHHYEPALRRTNGCRCRDRTTLQNVSARAATVADVVALYSLRAIRLGGTGRAAGRSASQALQWPDRMHLLSIPWPAAAPTRCR